MAFKLVFPPSTLKKKGFRSFADFYRIEGPIPKSDLIPIAEELERLSYVIYCSVTPDTTDIQPPELPFSVDSIAGEESAEHQLATPDFTSRQGYLNGGTGMNIRQHWGKAYGRSATLLLMDFGVYRNHEDLGNVRVVTSRPETQDCKHGTASAGCIVATKNTFGVTGIAHGCLFYFFDAANIDTVLQHSNPSQIIALDSQLSRGGTYVPLTDSKAHWDRVKGMTDRGATVVLAAGNGGVNLGSFMNNWGDSGSMLAGACDPNSGRKLSFSNYGHYTSWINSWGSNVTTTGYGDLQGGGNNVSYTSSYNGTSSATPLAAAALAVTQGYGIQTKGIYYQPAAFREAVRRFGYTDGQADGIGYRPDIGRWIDAWDQS